MRNREIINQEELFNRVDGDMELLQELFDLFWDDSPRLLSVIEKAIVEKNGDKLKEAAHSLKGTVGNFAAHKAYALAWKLEIMGEEENFINAYQVYLALKREIDRVKIALQLLLKETPLPQI